MAAPSVRSTGSGGKSSSPTTVDGVVFLKVKQCPMSGKKNTDLNVIPSGRWGPDYSKHLIWHRGNSLNPEGKFERVSILAWQHGGFADQWPDPDEFLKQLKADSNLQKEFDAAYKSMVLVIEEGRMRFKGVENDKLNLKTPFRAIAKQVYEKAHPGRIEKQQG